MDNLRTTDLDEPALWLSELAVRWAERGIRVQIIWLHAPRGGSPSPSAGWGAAAGPPRRGGREARGRRAGGGEIVMAPSAFTRGRRTGGRGGRVGLADSGVAFSPSPPAPDPPWTPEIMEIFA